MGTSQIADALAAFSGTLEPDGSDVDDLRLLMALQESTRQVAARLAPKIATPVRAAVFTHVTERWHRDAGRQQFIAAAAARDAGMERLATDQIDAIGALLRDPSGYLSGDVELPGEPPARGSGRPIYVDAGDFLQQQLKLSPFAARHRLESAGHLIGARQADGTRSPARYPALAGVLAEGAGDPREVAAAAKKLERMRPVIEQQPDASVTAAGFEARVAESLAGTQPGATGKLLRTLEAELDATAAEPSEEVKRARCGITYQGIKSGLHYYQLVCDALDSEFLRGFFDALDNPHTLAGAIPAPSAGTPSAGTPSAGTPSNGQRGEAPTEDDDVPGLPALGGSPIPDWAIDAGTPPELRPAEDFTNDPVTDAAAFYRQPTRPAEHLAALLESMRRAAAGASAEAGKVTVLPRVEVIVHIDHQTLLGETERVALTAHGTLLSPETVRRIACNAGILPVQFDGSGAVLDVGRAKRRFPDQMARVIMARDRGCCNPGCTMPASRCELHHIVPWFDGGPTSVANGCCLCSRCHHTLHSGRLRLISVAGVPHVVLPRDADPRQVPRRNAYWHPEARSA